jgi:hypothetical protein
MKHSQARLRLFDGPRGATVHDGMSVEIVQSDDVRTGQGETSPGVRHYSVTFSVELPRDAPIAPLLVVAGQPTQGVSRRDLQAPGWLTTLTSRRSTFPPELRSLPMPSDTCYLEWNASSTTKPSRAKL